MALFDKLKFWKKDNDLLDQAALPEKNPFDEPLPNDPLHSQHPFGPQSSDPLSSHDDFADPFAAKKAFEQGTIKETPAVSPPTGSSTDRFALMEKDLEILSSKMDAIKSTIESMNQRLQHIEQIATKEQQKPRW